MVRRSPPRARRCVANEWRSACGVALSGRPSAPRIRAIASCTMRGDRGPPSRRRTMRSGFESKGAKRQIVLDRLANRRNDRRRARFLAFADDRDGIRSPTGASARRIEALPRCAGPRRSRAPAPRRRAPRPRARAPRLPAARSWSSPWRPTGLRPGEAPPGLGRADCAERRGCFPAFARDMAGERFEGGERALQRAALDPFRPPLGEKSAQIAWGQLGEIGDARRRAKASCEKGEELPGVAAVSLDCARRQAPLVGEVGEPGRRGGGRSGAAGRAATSAGSTRQDNARQGLMSSCGPDHGWPAKTIGPMRRCYCKKGSTKRPCQRIADASDVFSAGAPPRAGRESR